MDNLILQTLAPLVQKIKEDTSKIGNLEALTTPSPTLVEAFNTISLTPGPKGDQGEAYYLIIESSNGNIFRPGQGQTTVLKARVFLNGEEVTDQIPESWFRWTRVSVEPPPPPNDDSSWNTAYYTGYKQVQVSLDDFYAKATFSCTIVSP